MTYFNLVILDESNRILNESVKQILLSRLGLSCENTHLVEAVIFQRRMLRGGGHESCRLSILLFALRWLYESWIDRERGSNKGGGRVREINPF